MAQKTKHQSGGQQDFKIKRVVTLHSGVVPFCHSRNTKEERQHASKGWVKRLPVKKGMVRFSISDRKKARRRANKRGKNSKCAVRKSPWSPGGRGFCIFVTKTKVADATRDLVRKKGSNKRGNQRLQLRRMKNERVSFSSGSRVSQGQSGTGKKTGDLKPKLPLKF